ncbi:diguanylate cyclase [Planosporangium sp. 12N6]|uniref:tetratricopeptide repeat-containing diguanylate cyclase n=1 Tax=Planosporangium spinosum TaxID=3402278 RepID=UPI003CEAADB2
MAMDTLCGTGTAGTGDDPGTPGGGDAPATGGTAMTADLPAIGDLPAPPPGVIDDLADVSVETPYAEYRVVAALRAMEMVPNAQVRTVAVPAERAERLATEWDRPELRMRARLVRADALLRDGDAIEAGRIAEQARAWAAEHDDAYLRARSHCQLARFFYYVGDFADALAHAVQCVAHTPDDVPPRLRAMHLLTLAMVAYDAGSPEDALRRNQEALEIATAIGDGDLSLQILNNMAYTAYQSGDHERAERLTGQIQAAADRHGITLHVAILDTIARIHLIRGRYAEAEGTLRPYLEEYADEMFIARNALAECLRTVAEAQRMRGDTAAARASLERAAAVCDERGLGFARARVREQQAELHAEMGNYRAAYEEYRRFHIDLQALQSEQRDARARALQAVYETEEARRESLRFRELAQRDALTGLYNRRYVDERLALLLEQTAARGAPLSAALVDLDHFKRVNDTLSHATGDAVLVRLAALLADVATGDAVAARLGGEEFLLILPDTDADEAVRRCEGLRRAVSAHPWRAVTGALPVTASIGVTTVSAGAITASALLARADRNLYAAKRAGRNRVVADPA